MAQIFPRWSNEAPRYILIGALVGLGALIFVVYYWASPWHTDVGYAPKQPVPYSHRLHVSELGMDCRYCHNIAERSPHAGVPPTETCMNCHQQIKADSPKLSLVRESWEKDTPIPWIRIHKVPDYAYFDHSAHLGFGVGEHRGAIGCETCHGRIDTMEIVRQERPLSMQWCVECHSDPADAIRPVSEITTMGYAQPAAWRYTARQIAQTLAPPGSVTRAHQLRPDGTHATVASYSCSGCHR